MAKAAKADCLYSNIGGILVRASRAIAKTFDFYMPDLKRAILILLSLCLAAGGSTHVMDIARGGFLPYDSVPIPINIFWTSLAVLDFAAVLLLWKHRNAGVLLTVAIMCADVSINSYASYVLDIPFKSFAPLQAQSIFLGFVLGTSAFIWQKRLHNHKEIK